MSTAVFGRKLPALQQMGVWPALALLLLLLAATEPGFFRAGNLENVLQGAAILGIVTVGQVLVLMTAGIDLSVGAMVGVTAVAIAEVGRGAVSAPVAVGAVLLIAVVVGLTNGLLVTRRQVPPVVATFGMFVTLEGARVAYTRGSVSGSVPSQVIALGQGDVAGVPYVALAWIAIVVIGTVLLRRSVPGRRLVMAGANERMASLSGVSVTRVKTAAYVTSALLAVVGGVFFAGFIGYVDRFIGRGMDLDTIAAALLGGTTFTGGRGSLVHAAGGALLIVALMNAIVVSGLDVQLQLVAKGVVLIGAVALQMWPSRRSRREAAATSS
jgi:ribose/xylose/arabinose/galactoside ABC-type transport system permease subunit